MIVCTILNKLKLTARSTIRSNQTCGRFCKSLNNRVDFAINSNPNQAEYFERNTYFFRVSYQKKYCVKNKLRDLYNRKIAL